MRIWKYEEKNGYIVEKPVRMFTGMKDSEGNEIYDGDTIEFKYEDKNEESGFGVCRGKVEFEFGCFVVKENFTYRPECPPNLLCDWLDEACVIIKENKE